MLGDDSVRFIGHAWVRVGRDKVEAAGEIHQFSVAVEGSPKLILNGAEAKATVEGGRLVYQTK